MLEALESHYHEFFGPHRSTVVDLSENTKVDLLIFPPTEERPIYTIATRGLSTKQLNPPKGLEENARQELLIYLPGEWEFDIDKPGTPCTWACAFLKQTARYMIDQNVYMGPGSVAHTEKTRHPTFFRYPYAILVPPLHESPKFFSAKLAGNTISFSMLLLITEAEADFMKKNGFQKLMLTMNERETFDPVLQPLRPCTVEGKEDEAERTERLKLVDIAMKELEEEDRAAAAKSPQRQQRKAPLRSGNPAPAAARKAEREFEGRANSAMTQGCVASTLAFVAAAFLVGSNWWDRTAPKGSGIVLILVVVVASIAGTIAYTRKRARSESD